MNTFVLINLKPLQSSDNRLVVLIDKNLQNSKRDKIGSIVMPQQYMDYTNNLQFGTILSFGDTTKKIFPDIEIGDVAIFEHTIEYKVETTAKRTDSEASKKGDTHLIDIDENGNEIRHLIVTNNRHSQLYGIFKNDTIIPSKGMIFCSIEARQTEFQKNEKGIYVNSDKQKVLIAESLAVASEAVKELELANSKVVLNEFNFVFKENLMKMLAEATEARDILIKRLNAIELIELTVLFTNPLDKIEVERGDVVLMDSRFVYPINLFGSEFLIIREYDWIVAKKNK